MAAMRAIGATIFAVLAAQGFAALAIMYSGVFNVAATDPHWGITRAIFNIARVRSIKAQASGIKPLENLADHWRVVAGTSHFAEHCSSCHSAPGVEAGEIAKGMYPPPPDLKDASRQWSSGELFWIIRHGIKMSGMPASVLTSPNRLSTLPQRFACARLYPTFSEASYGFRPGRRAHDARITATRISGILSRSWDSCRA
jgi:cytochrome c1